MLFQLKTYLKFLLKSTNEHAVHSPFAFNLLTKCFYTKSELQKSSNLKGIRTHLFQNKNSIIVKDFGKGSKVFKTNKRPISRIAKVAGISNKRSKLLIRMVAYFQSENILEVGTSVGLGTASLALGNPAAKITSLEGCPNTANVAIDMFSKFNLSNIEVKIGDFKDTLSETIENKSFDLIYFDGNHQKEATIEYFNKCLKNIHNNSVFIFDDIHWSIEMEQAWKTIINNPKVTVSIDTYFWGIIFFRQEQKKEHFVIRI